MSAAKENTQKTEKTVLFDELELSGEMRRALADMEFVEATPVQGCSIPVMLEGHDILAQAPTGTGKTASFGIPVIEKTDPSQRSVSSLILCPTRELVVQTANELLRLTKYKKGIRVIAIYGGQSIDRQILALKKKPQIVVATPGRLMDHMRRRTVRLDHLERLVLDEADVMLDMGFAEDIDEILKSVPEERQTVLFSATMPREIINISGRYLNKPEKIRVTKSEITVKSVKQFYLEVTQDRKTDVLARLIDVNDFKLSMVFCNTKRKTDELAHEMTARGYNAMGLHGDMKQSQRDRVMNAFKSGRVEILISTDVAARGIDIRDVDAVFNYDLPEDMEYYVHRIGRTGRANREGVSYSLVSRREMYRLHEIMRYTKARIKFTTVPNVAEITNVRIRQTMAGITDLITHTNLNPYAEAIQQFIDEADDDFTILDIAAAFLCRESGTEDLEEIESFGKGKGRSDRGAKAKRKASPAGSVRMFVNCGRMDRVSPGHLKKLLIQSGASDGQIYDIDIMEKFSFVEVDRSVSESVLVNMNGALVNGRRLNVEISLPRKNK